MTLEPLMPGDIDRILGNEATSPTTPFDEDQSGASLAENLVKYKAQLRQAWNAQNPSVDDDKEEIIRKSRALFINLVPDIAEGVAYLISCAKSESVRLQAMKFGWEVVNGDQGRGGPLDPLQRFLEQLKSIPETTATDGDPQGARHIIDMELTPEQKGAVAKVTMGELKPAPEIEETDES